MTFFCLSPPPGGYGDSESCSPEVKRGQSTRGFPLGETYNESIVPVAISQYTICLDILCSKKKTHVISVTGQSILCDALLQPSMFHEALWIQDNLSQLVDGSAMRMITILMLESRHDKAYILNDTFSYFFDCLCRPEDAIVQRQTSSAPLPLLGHGRPRPDLRLCLRLVVVVDVDIGRGVDG